MERRETLCQRDADRAHGNMDGSPPQPIHEPSVNDDILERLIVRDHRDDDVSPGSVSNRGRSFGSGRYEFVGARRRPIPDGHVEAAANQSGCHRAAHISETHEGGLNWTSHVSPRQRS
jgi:hypothetical protein